MSGRELVFDSSVVRDLNRHLRSVPRRPDAEFLVQAITNAATSISARDGRIRQLEEQHREVEDLVEHMKSKLGELMRAKQTADALVKAEGERADRAEAKATKLGSRIEGLEGDLDAALTDLHRIADVITGSLVSSGR